MVYKFQKYFLRILFRIFGVLLLAAAILFGWHNQISRFDADFRSPYDEHTHFDYWWRIYEKNVIPQVYDRIYFESLSIWSCYDDNKKENPTCESDSYGPSERENTASNYPPTFYAATAGMARLLNLFIKTDNLFHLAKLSNLVWGLICVVLVAWLALILKVPLVLAAVLVFAVGQTPAFVFAGITLNQEMFVLLFCLLGLIWYAQRTIHVGTMRFALETGLLAGICLSIKPTALLLPVVIAVAELLASPTAWTHRMRRIIGFSLVVIIVYLVISVGINQWRGVNVSDGKMRDYLLSFRDGRGTADWKAWTAQVWTSFTRSTASLHWRNLVDWDLPWLFMRFYQYVLIALVALIPYILTVEIKCKRAALSARLFAGSVLAFVILPVALAVYLSFGDFPYFFQARYYTAYIVIAVVLATAFWADLVRDLIEMLKAYWSKRKAQGESYAL